MAVALIVAAGRGERLGADRPKAFVMLAGRRCSQWSVEALRRVAAVDRVIVALPPGAGRPAARSAWPARRPPRSESVRARAGAGRPGGDPVVVHDAARPLAAPELFARTLAELEASGCDAAVAAAPVTDTIKEAGRRRCGARRSTEPRCGRCRPRRSSAARRWSARWTSRTPSWPRPPTTPGSSSGRAGRCASWRRRARTSRSRPRWTCGSPRRCSRRAGC